MQLLCPEWVCVWEGGGEGWHNNGVCVCEREGGGLTMVCM